MVKSNKLEVNSVAPILNHDLFDGLPNYTQEVDGLGAGP